VGCESRVLCVEAAPSLPGVAEMSCPCCLPAAPVAPTPDAPSTTSDPAPAAPQIDSSPPPPKPAAAAEPPKPKPAAPTPAASNKSPSLTVNQILSMDPAAVIATMQNSDYHKDTELMGAACKQLRVLCRQDEHCVMCDTLGAAGEVAKTMTTHQTVPEVQQQACAALINLCSARRVEPRDHAAESGALQAIVMAMSVHIEYPGIQEMAIIAIQNIIIGQDANDKMRKERAVEAGALKAIVDAVKKYEDTPSVLDQGAATLRLLCSKDKNLRKKAEEFGAKKDWLKSSGGMMSSRMGLTSRMLGRNSK